MSYIEIYLKTDKKNMPGFNKMNDYTLSFHVIKGSKIKDLLNNFNAHRRPKYHIIELYDINQECVNDIIIQEKATYYF